MNRRTINHEGFYYNDGEEKKYLYPEENKKDKNIKGVEFEVNDINENKTNSLIDELIDRKEICSKDTQHEYQRKILNATLSYDGTVHHEIVLQAEQHRNIMRKIKALNEFLNPNNIVNRSGTSMHIHMNKQYIINMGLTPLDVVKAGEAIASTLYYMSGRKSQDELNEWVRTRIGKTYDIPIKDRCQYVDDIELVNSDYAHHPGHYSMINVSNDATIEIRMFSNIHNFEYNHSKICLEMTDMLLDVASNMKGILYANNYEIPIEIIRDFFNKNGRRRKYYNTIKDSVALTQGELNDAYQNRVYRNIYNKLTTCHGLENTLRELRSIQERYDISYDGMISFAHIEDDLDVISRNLSRQINR